MALCVSATMSCSGYVFSGKLDLSISSREKRRMLPTRHLPKLVFVAIFLLAAASNGFTQATDERWRSVEVLNSGTKLIIETDASTPIIGKFSSANGQTLKIRRGGKVIDIPRATVAAIYSARSPSRWKRGLIGALAGAGAGLLVGGVMVAATKGDPLIPAGGVLIGLPVGAAIGAATGKTKRGALIYSR